MTLTEKLAALPPVSAYSIRGMLVQLDEISFYAMGAGYPDDTVSARKLRREIAEQYDALLALNALLCEALNDVLNYAVELAGEHIERELLIGTKAVLAACEVRHEP